MGFPIMPQFTGQPWCICIHWQAPKAQTIYSLYTYEANGYDLDCMCMANNLIMNHDKSSAQLQHLLYITIYTHTTFHQ